MEIRRIGSEYWIFTFSGSEVAGPYNKLTSAKKTYPKASCGSGITLEQWAWN